jgi:hypothetical protein
VFTRYRNRALPQRSSPRSGSWRRTPLRHSGAGDQRDIVSPVTRPGRRPRRGGFDIDPRCGCEPRTDAALGLERGGQSSDRVNTRIPPFDYRHARAPTRHLAPLPESRCVNKLGLRCARAGAEGRLPKLSWRADDGKNLFSCRRPDFCHCGPAAIGPSRKRLARRGHDYFGAAMG